jgi:hypothetical protein
VVALQAIAELEQGLRGQHPQTLRKLAKALGIAAGELLPGDRLRG